MIMMFLALHARKKLHVIEHCEVLVLSGTDNVLIEIWRQAPLSANPHRYYDGTTNASEVKLGLRPIDPMCPSEKLGLREFMVSDGLRSPAAETGCINM